MPTVVLGGSGQITREGSPPYPHGYAGPEASRMGGVWNELILLHRLRKAP